MYLMSRRYCWTKREHIWHTNICLDEDDDIHNNAQNHIKMTPYENDIRMDSKRVQQTVFTWYNSEFHIYEKWI